MFLSAKAENPRAPFLWVTQDHLDLRERAITQARKAVIELQDRVANCASTLVRETEIAR